MFGPQSYFRENGTLDSMNFYTQNEVNWLTIKLGEKKNITSINGKLLHITIDDKNPYFDSIPVQYPLLLLNDVATIKGMKTVLNMKLKQKDVVLVDTTIEKFVPFFNSYLTGLKHKFDKKGSYEFFASITLADSLSGKEIYTDTFARRITVY